jgi:hypothetical protein
MERFPLRVDDTLLIARDDVSKRLGRKLKGKFVGFLPFKKEEKIKLKRLLKKKQIEAFVIPERVELIHRLGKLPKNSNLKNILIGSLEHEYAHLSLLKGIPHHKVLSLAIDGLLLSYLAGLEAKKVGKYIEMCLEASNIHSKWLHEGYAIDAEIKKLYNFRESKETEKRIADLKSLKDKVSLIGKHELKCKSHEIGLRLVVEASRNLKMKIPKLASFIHSFYAEFKIRGENKKFVHTYIPDYLLIELANLKYSDLTIENDLPEAICRISQGFAGPLGHKIERISVLRYAPIREIKRKIEKEYPILKVLPEEFQSLCEPICKNPLRDVLTCRYVTWDLGNNGERSLFTDGEAFKAVKRKKCASTLLLKLQELKADILPFFIKNMDLDWSVNNFLSFDEFIRKGECPKIYFGSEPVDWMEDKQPKLQQKYGRLISDLKSFSN